MLDYRREDENWRKLTGPNATRDLSATTQERMQEIAVHLWETNPLGRWIINIITDFIVADGLPFESENEDVSRALEDFYFDPLNQLDVYLKKHVGEQQLFGELCLPAWTAEQTGYLRVGYIDPVQIGTVVTDPENVKMKIGVILKSSAAGQEGRRLRTILPRDADFVLSQGAKELRASFTDGECFFSAVNNLTNSPRGRSELLVSADWLDAYEQLLFDCADRWPLLNSFIWHMVVKGGTAGKDGTIQQNLNNLTKKAGSAFGTNENVTLDAVTPDLKTQEIDTGARVLRNHILGGHGLPSFWFGGGEDSNRATSVEQGTPTFKMLSSKQREFRAFAELMLQTVIDRRRAARTLTCSDEDSKNWSVVLPELTSRDLTKNSAALQQVTTSLGTAIQQEVIDTVTARKIFLFIAASLGIEIDEADVESRLKEEAEKREQTDYSVKPSPTGTDENRLDPTRGDKGNDREAA